MRIFRRERAGERIQLLRAAGQTIARDAAADSRVCGAACRAVCASCGRADCRCRCAPGCPDASRLLSSEPDGQPIEAGILPLVLELKRLGAFVPCWSCEGHDGPGGGLWKVPRVWFYCDSAAAVTLLANAVGGLAARRRLKHRWQVTAVPAEHDNPDMMYSLEPAFGPGETASLADLRQDVRRLADELLPLDVPG